MDNPESSMPVTPPSSVPPVILAPTPKASHFPIFFAVLILILLAATGIFVYQNIQLQKQIVILQSQPTPTPLPTEAPAKEGGPTANWKTYTNNVYKFSLKYPQNLFVESDGVSKTPIQTAYLFHVVDNKQNSNFSFSVSIDPTPKSPMGKTITTLNEAAGAADNKQTVIFAGKEAISWHSTNSEGETNKGVLFFVEKDLWMLNLNVSHQSDISTGDQILSTFKFTEPNGENQPIISMPSTNSKVTSPLIIKGTVPAGWMFEGVFPIKLVDEGKKLIVQSQGKETVSGSWTSGKAIEFNASLTFTTTAKSGFIILENDNASGLPENNKSFEIPVNF